MKVVRMVYETIHRIPTGVDGMGWNEIHVPGSTVMVVLNTQRDDGSLQRDLNIVIGDESILERVETLFVAAMLEEDALPLVEAFLKGKYGTDN